MSNYRFTILIRQDANFLELVLLYIESVHSRYCIKVHLLRLTIVSTNQVGEGRSTGYSFFYLQDRTLLMFLVRYILHQESAKLHALRALLPYVTRTLRASCPTCSRASRASYLTCSNVNHYDKQPLLQEWYYNVIIVIIYK